MKNFLNKKVENVTAPKEWQSSPDSPPTKLAYITQPEIDLLVKANIHGSMKGKPNKGPQGIMSLDGGGIDEAYSEKVKDFKPEARLDMSKSKDREKRQKFRERTGSTVVSEPEAQERILAGDLSDDFLEDLSQSANTLSGTNLAKYGLLPGQQFKFNWQDLLPGKSYAKVFTNLIGAFTGENQKRFFENLQTKLDEGQNLSVAEQSELIRYLNLTDSWRKGLSEEDQSKLDTAKDAFLPNVSTTEGGGIGDFEDEYIQNILARVQGNPDLTFMQSLGIGVPDDYLSQTEAMKLLGKTGVASLQAFNPETYYGDVDQGGFGFRPRTQAELEALAKLDISSDGPYAGNKGLIREIARAREELRRQKGGGGDNQQAGIPSIVPPPVTPPPSAGPGKPIVPFPPPFMPTLPFPPQLVQGAPPSIYSNFPQFNLSTYAQRGIADPNLAAFYQNLGRIA
jgi:hypothetical protein